MHRCLQMVASENQENSKPRDTANTDTSTKLTRHLILLYSWPCDVSAVWRDAKSRQFLRKVCPRTQPTIARYLTSPATKLLEHIVRESSMDHLHFYCLLSNLQHTFRKEHSCDTQSSRTMPLQLDQAVKWTSSFSTSAKPTTPSVINPYYKDNVISGLP